MTDDQPTPPAADTTGCVHVPAFDNVGNEMWRAPEGYVGHVLKDATSARPDPMDGWRRLYHEPLGADGVTEPPDLGAGWTAVRTDQWLSTLAAGDRAKYAEQLLHRAVYLREYGEDRSGLTWDRWLRETEMFLRGGDQ